MTGRVVVLNGGSSSGKTTLGRALQAALPGTWLQLGVDVLLWLLPPRLFPSDEGIRLGADGEFLIGPEFRRQHDAFRHAAAALARAGSDVIVDEVFLRGAVERDLWAAALDGLDVCWVAVRCDPDVAEARERARGDRHRGIARWQAARVHDEVTYDVEVDSGTLTREELVAEVYGALAARWGLGEMTGPVDVDDPRAGASAWPAPAPWES